MSEGRDSPFNMMANAAQVISDLYSMGLDERTQRRRLEGKDLYVWERRALEWLSVLKRSYPTGWTMCAWTADRVRDFEKRGRA